MKGAFAEANKYEVAIVFVNKDSNKNRIYTRHFVCALLSVCIIQLGDLNSC